MLLLADEAELTRRLETFLTARGLQVVSRGGGSNPFDALATEAPDAVLVDMNARGIDALDFLGKLRANRLYVGLPTFLVSDGVLTPEMQDKLSALHAILVPREDPVAALDQVLGVLFPSVDRWEQSG